MSTLPRSRGPLPRTGRPRTRPGTFSINSSTKELARLKRDFDNVLKTIRTDTYIVRLSRVAVNMMRHRTLRGIDVHGNPFTPYSDYWACVRKEKGLVTRKVELRFSGQMFDSVRWKIKSPTRSVIDVASRAGFGNDTPRDLVAEYHQRGGGRLPKREWFGFTPKQIKSLERERKALLTQALLDQITDSRPLGSDISALRGRPKFKQISSPTANYLGISKLCRHLRGSRAA